MKKNLKLGTSWETRSHVFSNKLHFKHVEIYRQSMSAQN